MNELDLQPAAPSAWDEDRIIGAESPTEKGPRQQHPETDNGRWELTTATVGPTPARLTLTGVWSDAATVDAFISAVSCRREKKKKQNNQTKEVGTRKATTQLLHTLGSHIP